MTARDGWRVAFGGMPTMPTKPTAMPSNISEARLGMLAENPRRHSM